MKGEGNQQDYGMRVYDPRLGRFLSVDPITAEYPELTPYQFAGNKVITSVDLDGLENYDYRGAKVNRLSYTSRKWYQDPVGIFGSNSIRSAWNQLVGMTETDVNFLSDPKGTTDRFKKHVVSSVFKGLIWLSATTDEERADFVKKKLIDVKTYEDITGTLILGNLASKATLPSIKLSADLPPGMQLKGFSFPRRLMKAASEFKLVHLEETILKSEGYKAIQKLSDSELIQSVTSPKNGDVITINSRTGNVVDGNTRIYKL
ncbi:RHS repeat-associated core domain-containing protein [Chitinophaga sp. CF418]|nr:RHS repeat-associated core domain-containing protein [Chitinophaga sp. CF418]